MQLDGNLDKFPLRELIEMVTYSSVTGVLEVRTGDEIGQIFFTDGRPYHAVAGERAGLDAVAAMFEERDAPFRFVADQEIAETTIWHDTWELIERGEEQAQLWLGLRKRIASIECVPVLCGAPAASQVHISETAWPVLSAINGQRTVGEVAGYLNIVLVDAYQSLIVLADQGLVTIQPPRQHPKTSGLFLPKLADAPSSSGDLGADGANLPEPTSAGGFLERLLAEAKSQEQQRPELTDDEAQERKRVYRYVDDRR